MARSLIDDQPGKLFEISDEAGINFKPTITCDGENRVWVVWSATRANWWHILARSIADGQLGVVVQLSENDSPECFLCAMFDEWRNLRS